MYRGELWMKIWGRSLGHRISAMRFGGRIIHDA
jgi:hypothetical protein